MMAARIAAKPTIPLSACHILLLLSSVRRQALLLQSLLVNSNMVILLDSNRLYTLAAQGIPRSGNHVV